MPYKDAEEQKRFQREWVATRRALFLEDKHCRACAEKGTLTVRGLEIDHIDPKKKWNHRIWSYSWTKIMKEISKCQILCSGCHYEKTRKDGSEKDKYKGPSYN